MSSHRPPKGTCCGGACVCCPYGCTYTAPILFVIVAMIATTTATFGCHFFTTTVVNEEVFGTTNPIKFHTGLWIVENFVILPNGIKYDVPSDDEECVGWGSSSHTELDQADLDGAMVFARAISLLSCLAAFVFMITFLFGSCMRFVPHLTNIMSVFFGLFGVCAMLSLVALASSWCKDAEDCMLQGSGIAAVVAFFLWTAAGLLTFLTLRERELFALETRQQQQEHQGMEMPSMPTATAAASMVPGSTTETVEQTIIEEDGSVFKVITTTAVHPDGSKSVTETKQLLQQGRPPYTPVAATVVADDTIPMAQTKLIRC